ncbi:MAG: hypothetical protein R8G33_07530 [Gammaproteobacteria bacterium]|nr:hypothetical protein [Gammaproteobacteria bacterium]
MMNNSENINKLKKSRSVWLIVAVVAALGALMRWFGVYGEGPGTINWLTVIMFIIAIVIVINRHIKLRILIQ